MTMFDLIPFTDASKYMLIGKLITNKVKQGQPGAGKVVDGSTKHLLVHRLIDNR